MGHYDDCYEDYYAQERAKENAYRLKQYKKALDLLEKSRDAADLPMGVKTTMEYAYDMLEALLAHEISKRRGTANES